MPGFRGGTGGGGAILVASNAKITVGGTIRSGGGGSDNDYAGQGFGSGGAIRLLAPLVTGNGLVTVPGYRGGDYSGTSGGGRIRIDCTDNQAYKNLTLTGAASRGNRMVAFPVVIPQLDILEVAGNVIPDGTNSPAMFELAGGSSTNQTVKVQARNFTNDVAIRVVITPENGPSGSFDATILQSSGNPPFATVPVVIPAGSVCRIHAWKR